MSFDRKTNRYTQYMNNNSIFDFDSFISKKSYNNLTPLSEILKQEENQFI
jgi:hypothetical protein